MLIHQLIKDIQHNPAEYDLPGLKAQRRETKQGRCGTRGTRNGQSRSRQIRYEKEKNPGGAEDGNIFLPDRSGKQTEFKLAYRMGKAPYVFPRLHCHGSL